MVLFAHCRSAPHKNRAVKLLLQQASLFRCGYKVTSSNLNCSFHRASVCLWCDASFLFSCRLATSVQVLISNMSLLDFLILWSVFLTNISSRTVTLKYKLFFLVLFCFCPYFLSMFQAFAFKLFGSALQPKKPASCSQKPHKHWSMWGKCVVAPRRTAPLVSRYSHSLNLTVLLIGGMHTFFTRLYQGTRPLHSV